MKIYKVKIKKRLKDIGTFMLGCGLSPKMFSYEGKEIYVFSTSVMNDIKGYRQTDITGIDRSWYWDPVCFETDPENCQDEDNQI